MIDFSKIYKWSLGYEIGRYLVFPLYLAFYRKIQVVNKKIIPKNRPIIFALNHQNALMDALPFCFLVPELQVVFLARADIFRKTLMAKILRGMKIMPVFRIRDGAENLSKNDSTFLNAANILKKGKQIGMMPEGNHGDKRRLRKINKGIFRIAMKAQEGFGREKGVVIIPVGFDFENYQKYRGTLLMNFGDPIEVNQFYDLYTENAANCFNEMRKVLRPAMTNVMIDIPSDDYYHTIDMARRIYRKTMCCKAQIPCNTIFDKFKADKKTIDQLNQAVEKTPGNMDVLKEKVDTYLAKAKNLNFRNWIIGKKPYSLLKLFIESLAIALFFPLYLVGRIINYVPYELPKKPLQKIKDPQFVSSFYFGIGLLSFYLYYLIVILPLVLWLVPQWYYQLAALIVLPHMGLFSSDYIRWYKKFKARVRYTRMLRNKNPHLMEVITLKNEIVKIMDAYFISNQR